MLMKNANAIAIAVGAIAMVFLIIYFTGNIPMSMLQELEYRHTSGTSEFCPSSYNGQAVVSCQATVFASCGSWNCNYRINSGSMVSFPSNSWSSYIVLNPGDSLYILEGDGSFCGYDGNNIEGYLCDNPTINIWIYGSLPTTTTVPTTTTTSTTTHTTTTYNPSSCESIGNGYYTSPQQNMVCTPELINNINCYHCISTGTTTTTITTCESLGMYSINQSGMYCNIVQVSGINCYNCVPVSTTTTTIPNGGENGNMLMIGLGIVFMLIMVVGLMLVIKK